MSVVDTKKALFKERGLAFWLEQKTKRCLVAWIGRALFWSRVDATGLENREAMNYVRV